MLPKQYRLDPKLIPLIARKGKKFSHELMDIRYLPEGDIPQFAISVSLKVSKNATVRNGIRRKLRPAIVELASQNKFKPGKYLLITKSADLLETDPINLLTSLIG